MNISVVIPAFNRGDLLSQTLDAVLAQTRAPAEIIVVDDGSTDNTSEVLKAYEPRIRAIRIPNAGELVTRNTGLHAASGDLVAFCDSDDMWRPDYLATMTEMWQAEPDLRVTYCNFVVIRDGAWQADTKFDAAPPGFWHALRPLRRNMAVFDVPIVDKLLRFQPFFPSAMMVDRRWFLEIGGWDESVSRIIGCDLATTLRIGSQAPIGVCYKPLVGIRKHDGNFSADVQKMNLGDSLVLETVLARSPAIAGYAPLVLRSITERRRAALAIAFSRRDLAAVEAIYTLLPEQERTSGVRLKRQIACLPRPFCRLSAEIMLSFGSVKSILFHALIAPLRTAWQ